MFSLKRAPSVSCHRKANLWNNIVDGREKGMKRRNFLKVSAGMYAASALSDTTFAKGKITSPKETLNVGVEGKALSFPVVNFISNKICNEFR